MIDAILPAAMESAPSPGPTVRSSNRLTGERMVADEVAWLGNKASELMADYRSNQPDHRLHTFEDVETLWEDVVKPHLGEFETMKSGWTEDASLDPESVWYANWKIPEGIG